MSIVQVLRIKFTFFCHFCLFRGLFSVASFSSTIFYALNLHEWKKCRFDLRMLTFIGTGKIIVGECYKYLINLVLNYVVLNHVYSWHNVFLHAKLK